MNHKFIVAALFGLLIFPTCALSLRCGNDLVNNGDLKHEVLLACGTPYSTEIIGHIDQERNGDRITVMKIEEWIIRESGKDYSLVFEGNRLVKIESAGGI
jgi:hypothetical protein